jgi:ubiquinone/menaquinone biosynthesis C-methylase UbiE
MNDGKQQDKVWTFNGWGANFENHIRSSIPGYQLTHDIALTLSDFFVVKDQAMFDLGTATGNFAARLASRHQSTPVVAVDSIDTMWNVDASTEYSNLVFEKADLTDFRFSKSPSFITSIFTIQFLPYADQRALLEVISSALPEGGGFFICEKEMSESGREELFFESALWDFKSQFFSEKEMANKKIGIRSALNTRTKNQQIDELKKAGFKEIIQCFQCLNFYGMIAIK